MTSLVRPDVALHESWAATMAELGTEGEHVPGAGVWQLPEPDRWDLSRAGCARLVDVLHAALDPPPADGDAAPGVVPCEFWWVTTADARGEEQVVGFLALRLRLTPGLLEEGGHIGYAIAPSQRRRGHASRALALAVRRSAELGLPRVLLTCDDTNLASARTIESAGGVYEDSRNGKRRYWIDTGA